MIIAFDVFGTVFDLRSAEAEDIKNYLHHIKRTPWSPLVLPKSWETLPAHPDSKAGIERLRKHHLVVTCSNGPLGLLAKLSKHNSISWDAIVPLELNKVFKPNPAAYMTICEIFDCPPSGVIMVTANEKFGDIEASTALGMEARLIRTKEIPTIVDLATQLGC